MGVPVGFDRIREWLNLLEGHGRNAYRIHEYLNEPGAWLRTFATDDLYVIVQATLSDSGGDRTFVSIYGGGAFGAAPQARLFQHLCTSTWRYDYGGPWARVMPDGLVSHGWRLVIPSDIFVEENLTTAFGFILGMVDYLGRISREQAYELIPHVGGRVFHDSDPEAFRHLIAGIVPPGVAQV